MEGGADGGGGVRMFFAKEISPICSSAFDVVIVFPFNISTNGIKEDGRAFSCLCLYECTWSLLVTITRPALMHIILNNTYFIVLWASNFVCCCSAIIYYYLESVVLRKT